MSMKLLLVYHFFHPDTVISARLFADLATDLRDAGHQVTVFTGNRLLRGEGELPEKEAWNGVEICRFRRPNFRQGSHLGRLLNSFILQLKWLCGLWRRRADFDAIIIGTDPQFTYLMFPWIRLICGKVRLIHWVFDLYPEAILVGSRWWMRLLAWLMKPLAWISYQFVDDMVDIGRCMRERLERYGGRCDRHTLTPWALVERSEPSLEAVDSGERITLLYSGTVGYAHDLSRFIALARECRHRDLPIDFCLAGYGNRFDDQVRVLTDEDINIRVAGFASESELAVRLSSADMHLISLRPGWEGIVVPSKFFGALAMGKPVLFDGPRGSCLARWCEEYGIGYVMDDVSSMADRLSGLDRASLSARGIRAYQVYREHFSREVVVGGWKRLLSKRE